MSFSVSWVYQAIDKFTPVARRVQRAARGVANKMDGFTSANIRTGATLDDLQGKMAKFAAVAATLFALAMPINQAIAFEAKMADIAKVVDFERPRGLLLMAKDIKELSKRIPLAQAGLADIAASGGQFGIAEKDLSKFTELVAKTSVAFDIIPKEAATAFARLSDIFEIPISEFERFADNINFLSNDMAADAAQLITGLRNKGAAAGRAMGLTKEQTLGLVGVLIKSGINADRVGSAMGVMARRLGDASIMGETFVNSFTQEPFKNMEKVLRIINKMPAGAKKNELTNKIFGEFGDRIRLVADTMDTNFIPTMKRATDAINSIGSVQKEFANRTATTDAQIQIFQNRLRNIGINIGTGILPALNGLMSVIGLAADIFADFVDVTGPLIPMMLGAATALLLVKAVTIAWTIAQIALNIAMAANPIGLIVIAITAAVIGVAFLIKKFKELGSVGNVFKALFNSIVDLVLFPLGALVKIFDAIAGTDFSKTFEDVTNKFKFDIKDANINGRNDISKTDININVNAPPGIVKSVETTSRGNVTPRIGQNMVMVPG